MTNIEKQAKNVKLDELRNLIITLLLRVIPGKAVVTAREYHLATKLCWAIKDHDKVRDIIKNTTFIPNRNKKVLREILTSRVVLLKMLGKI